MEYVYAAMLLHKAKKDLSEDAITKVLSAAGVEVDSTRVKALVAALNGVDIEEAIAKAAVSAAPAAVAAAEAAPAAKVEEKVEEKKDDGAAAAGLGALFG